MGINPTKTYKETLEKVNLTADDVSLYIKKGALALEQMKTTLVVTAVICVTLVVVGMMVNHGS